MSKTRRLPMRIALLIGAVPALAACASTVAEEPAAPVRVVQGDGNCDASGLQDHIGHKATAESGAVLLELSGARTLRWGPPNSAWTMDYRKDRVNVRYDQDMIITAITCG